MPNVVRLVVSFGGAALVACALLTPLDELRDGDASTGDGGACEAGRSVCGGECVDLATDGHNCGACNHDCLGGGCSSAACLPIVLASGQQAPFGIAVDSQNVYWANNDFDASFASCPLTGCADGATTLVSQQVLPSDVFVANGHLYMTAYGWSTSGAAGQVLACVPTDCQDTLTTLATTGPNDPVAIVADTSAVYWGDSHDGLIATCSTSGCGTPGTFAADVAGGPWFGLALAGGSLYWTSHAADAGAVFSCPLGGCATPTLVAASAGNPFDLAVDGANVYWTTAEGGQVLRCPLAGCGSDAPLVIADNQAYPSGIAVDATGVYWLNQNANTVLRCDLGGCGAGGPQVLASGQSEPWEIVLDATSVYWSNASSGQIMKLAKP